MPDPAVGYRTLFNTANESDYGDGAAGVFDRSYEIRPNEGIARANRVLTRQGMRGGTFASYPGTRRTVSGHDAKGPITVEVLPVSMGRLFKAWWGAAAILQQAATAAYLQTFTLGSLSDDSLATQKVIYDADGNEITTITHNGVKVVSGELAWSVDDYLALTLDLDAREEVKDVAAAAAAYASATIDPFHFEQATITLDGDAVAAVRSGTAKLTRALKVDRTYMGNQGLKDKPVEEDRPTFSGQLVVDIVNEVLYDAFVADGGGDLVVAFTGDNIASTYDRKVELTVPSIHVTGDTPKVGATGVLQATVPWEADKGSGAQLTYMSTDTAA